MAAVDLELCCCSGKKKKNYEETSSFPSGPTSLPLSQSGQLHKDTPEKIEIEIEIE